MAKAKPKPLDPVVDFPNPVKKQADLPGMENRAIEELEDAARRYAAIRDKRMALNEAEVKLKDLLLGLLKKHGKREYKRDGIEIWIKVEEETVKVKVTEDDEDRPPSTRKEKHEPIRNNENSPGANRTDQDAARSDPGADHESKAEGKEVGSKAGSTREPGDEESDVPF
jgi:hypothetical protein